MARDKAAKDPLAPRVSKVTKSVAKPKKSAINASKRPYTSAERVTASDDEDMEDAPAISQPATTDAESKSASEDDSDDESDDDAAAASKEASRKRIEQLAKGKVPVREASRPEIDDEEDEEQSGEDSRKDRAAPTPSRSNIQSAASTLSSKSRSTVPTSGRIDNGIDDSQLRPSKEFKAPSGFKSSKSENLASRTVDMLRPSNTGIKELWYISAPASLPITALKEVALEKFANAQAIMEHKGEHYALIGDPAALESTRILLPQDNVGYKAVPTPVTRVLQFQQVLNVQATSTKGRPKTTSQVLLDTHLPTKPSKRPQPRGMKMRFRPSGFGDGELGTIGSSDEEELSPSAEFREPPPLNGEPSKKKKKDRASKIAEKNAAYVTEAITAIDADQPTAPAEAVSLEGKKKKKKDKEGVETATGMEPRDEPMNGETIDADGPPLAAVDVANKKDKKDKKEKKRKAKEAEAEARAINRTAGESGDMEDADKKKKKKEKRAAQEA